MSVELEPSASVVCIALFDHKRRSAPLTLRVALGEAVAVAARRAAECAGAAAVSTMIVSVVTAKMMVVREGDVVRSARRRRLRVAVERNVRKRAACLSTLLLMRGASADATCCRWRARRRPAKIVLHRRGPARRVCRQRRGEQLVERRNAAASRDRVASCRRGAHRFGIDHVKVLGAHRLARATDRRRSGGRRLTADGRKTCENIANDRQLNGRHKAERGAAETHFDDKLKHKTPRCVAMAIAIARVDLFVECARGKRCVVDANRDRVLLAEDLGHLDRLWRDLAQRRRRGGGRRGGGVAAPRVVEIRVARRKGGRVQRGARRLIAAVCAFERIGRRAAAAEIALA